MVTHIDLEWLKHLALVSKEVAIYNIAMHMIPHCS